MVVRKQPLRKCLGCDEMLGKKGLLRVVKAPSKQISEQENLQTEKVIPDISLDLTGKKAGRGAYICRDAECFKKAQKRKSLERSLKCAIPNEVYESLLSEIEKLSP